MIALNKATIRTVGVGVDWGFTNPGVMLVGGLDGDGRLIVVHEVYRSQQLIGWWVDQGKRIKAHYAPVAFVCDPAEPAFIEEFRRAGLNAVEADNDIRAGIQAVQTRLEVAADGRPRLYLYDGALAERDELLAEAKHPTSTDQEFDAYAWPKGGDGKPIKEKPVDMYNHGMDALRYLVMWADRRGRTTGGVTLPKPEHRNVVGAMPKGIFRS